MKKIIQLLIFVIVFISIFIFYKLYFYDQVSVKLKKTSQTEEASSDKINNNTIENLKYNINLNEENSYSISSASSEIKYVNNNEIVYMTKVEAIFLGKDKQAVKIISDFAVYNKLDNQTFFEKNVITRYQSHSIFSDKILINLKNDMANIYDSVRYEGPNIELKADQINLNLTTKKIDIYMDDNLDNVEIELNK
jgi:LPS export ABC transporter protein LptC